MSTPLTKAVRRGDRCHKWTVIGEPFRVVSGKSRRLVCVAKCDCGTVAVTDANHLRYGHSRNCGCVRRVSLPASKTTHGGSKSTLYRVWKGIRERCGDRNHCSFHNYGGRGIRVCRQWLSYPTFSGWAYRTGWRPGLTIDRVNNDGNYEPENCRFVSWAVNADNTRRTRFREAWGERKTLQQWSNDSRCVVSKAVLTSRFKQGWALEEAMSTPIPTQRTGPVTAFGETKTVCEWHRDDRCAVGESCLRMRLFWYGWQPEDAITTPAAPRTKRVQR